MKNRNGYETLRGFSKDISQVLQERDDLMVMLEMQELNSAKYAALFFNGMEHNEKLYEKLQNQLEENKNALIGEFDDFCYSSTRAYSQYRSIDEMYVQGILTLNEYEKCKRYIMI